MARRTEAKKEFIILSSLCSSLSIPSQSKKVGKTIKKTQAPEINHAGESDASSRWLASSGIARLLLGVDVPDDVVRQSHDLVPGSLGHLGEALRLGLVLEGIAGEVDASRRVSASAGALVIPTYLIDARPP